MKTKTKKRVPHRERTTTPVQAVKAAASAKNGSSSSDQGALRKLYWSLLRCREIQERVRNLAASNASAARYQLAIGREAVAVGATAELGPEDTVAYNRSNLAARIASGVPVRTLRADGDDRSTATGISLPDDPFNLGTGLALCHKLEQKRHVVVALCPQEKPALEVWHHALKFAAVHRLPIVFVIENGIATEPSSQDEAPHLESFSFLARDYGFPGILVDGKDAVAVRRVAEESIHRARIGSGPTLIDCRTESRRDPLQHMEHYLRKRRAWDDTWRKKLDSQIAAELALIS